VGSVPVLRQLTDDQEFFRTSRNADQYIDVGTISDKQDMGRIYVVSGAILKDVIARFPKSVRVVRLVLTNTLAGTTFLWPVPLAEDRGGQL